MTDSINGGGPDLVNPGEVVYELTADLRTAGIALTPVAATA